MIIVRLMDALLVRATATDIHYVVNTGWVDSYWSDPSRVYDYTLTPPVIPQFSSWKNQPKETHHDKS